MKLLLIVTFTIAGLALAGDKNGVRVVQGSGGIAITVSTKKEPGFTTPGASKVVSAVYLKVHNQTDTALPVDYSSFYLKSASGKALRSLSNNELMARLPLWVKAITQRSVRKDIGESNEARIFPNGPVPPHTFTEGLVIFDGTGDAGNQKLPVTLYLPGLLKEPIPINW